MPQVLTDKRVYGWVAGLLLVATACAPAAPPAATSGPAAQPAQAGSAAGPTSASAPAAAAPGNTGASGGQLVIVQGADAETLDAQGGSTRSTLNVAGAISEPLTKVDYSQPGSPLAPVLALSWSQINDTTWQFKLRQGVTFTNGEPFDANAVKYSIERIKNPANNSRSLKYAASVSSVDIVDAYTVNLVTASPAPLVPLDMSQVYIVPPKYAEQAGIKGFGDEPIGTGPFKFVEWVKDDHVTLDANPDYWGGKPKLNRVTFKPIPEAATRSAAIRTGQADIVTPLAVSDADTISHAANVKLETTPSDRLMYLKLDQASNDVMKKPQVRQALNYAVDRDAIVKELFKGYAKPLQGQPLSAEYFGFDTSLQPYGYDPDKAKQLLAEAGYPNGFSTTLWTSRGRYNLDFETAQAVGGMWQKVGVKTDVKPEEWATYIKDMTDKKLTPTLLAAWATYPDADPMFDVFLKGTVYSYTDVPEFDSLVKEARSTMDRQAREQLLKKAAQVWHDQAMGVPLVQLENLYAVSNRVQGFTLFPNEGMDLLNVSVS